MEWLKEVDLSEYAPNLRGSGVHRGLILHEPRFTGELLASLLSIPTSKTLLRRHLAIHFKVTIKQFLENYYISKNFPVSIFYYNNSVKKPGKVFTIYTSKVTFSFSQKILFKGRKYM